MIIRGAVCQPGRGAYPLRPSSPLGSAEVGEQHRLAIAFGRRAGCRGAARALTSRHIEPPIELGDFHEFSQAIRTPQPGFRQGTGFERQGADRTAAEVPD